MWSGRMKATPSFSGTSSEVWAIVMRMMHDCGGRLHVIMWGAVNVASELCARQPTSKRGN